MGPSEWTYYYLYVIIDIFRRRVAGWCVADAARTALFKPLLASAIDHHAVPPGQLTLHADRGPSMKAKATTLLPADLGVIESQSWPHAYNDNPNRFVDKVPKPPQKPTAVWINPPAQKLQTPT